MIHQHCLLHGQGGASRVAALLAESLRDQGEICRETWELGLRSNQSQNELHPHEVNTVTVPEAIFHVHSSADWPVLLTHAQSLLGRTVVTLHDGSLLTGGCVYPLDCDGWKCGCIDPCPRAFPMVFERARKIRQALNLLDPVLVSPSQWLGKMAREVFPDQPCRVIPNGVAWPGKQPSKGAVRHRFGLHPAAKVVLFAAHGGEQAQYKGGALWRSVWSRIKAEVPLAVGVFVGGDKMVKQGDLLCFSHLGEKDLRELMTAADVFAVPSIADNHPLVILEAMASGAVCVAFAAGGIPEQIRDGETGFLVPVKDISKMAAQISQLLQTPHLAARVAETAFFSGQKRFSVQRMTADYQKLYQGLMMVGKPREDRHSPVKLLQ